MCRLHHRAQQYQLAIAHYSEAIRLQPGFVECHANLGHVLRDSGDLHVSQIVHHFESFSRNFDWHLCALMELIL
jgi:hypothetical protein